MRVDIRDLQRIGVRCLLDNLLEEHGVVRHNAARLSQLLIEEFVEAPALRALNLQRFADAFPRAFDSFPCAM